jgi:beta-lactamase regulating signal transducer with metallopeptidase domain
MESLLPIAAKSFLVAGIVLLLLKIARNRSASDRSWIAHLGLAAVLLLPVAAVALPALDVQGPAFLAASPEPAANIAAPAATAPAVESEAASPAARFPVAPVINQAPAPVDWAFWAYAAPAALLLLLTLIALFRLFGLKGRAQVMVEPNWLTALARAQSRMGFKHGTALLTSNELPSPISWGVMRPVILLNSEAAESHAEAEAIIAHELAHVASLDWAKLLLSRVVVAIFWFNPLVWVLAREAHQLREEAADDAVLGADIEDTDYARLLVGVARHQCRGMLIGAHGVAPSKNSLARRVRRVLDGALARAPGGWRWSTAAAFFAAGMAVPLAALNFVPTTPASAASNGAEFAKTAAPAGPSSPYYANANNAASDISSTVDNVMATTVTGASSVAHPHSDKDFDIDVDFDPDIDIDGDHAWHGYGPKPGTIGPKPGTVGPRPGTVGPRGNFGPRVSISADGAISMAALGVTPEYIAAIQAAAPQLRRLASDDLVSLKAVGVNAAYIQELANAGFRHLNADDLVSARALNIRGDYVRAIGAAGYRNLSLDQLVELRAVGVSASDIERFRRAGHTGLTVDQLVQLKALGGVPEHARDRTRKRDDGS